MDSNDLEREKGITILAEEHRGAVRRRDVEHRRHPGSRRLRRRGRARPRDGRRCAAARRRERRARCRRRDSCLRKALEAHLPVILVVNKVDRPDARITEVVDETYELFIDLGATEEQIEFPIIYANARAGWASPDADVEGSDLKPLCELILQHIPPPEYEEGHPFQAMVTNLDASPYVGRLAICRVRNGIVQARPVDRVVPARRDDREGEDHRALHDRSARPRRRRVRRAGRHHRDRGLPRHHDRRDPRRSRRPAPVAAA